MNDSQKLITGLTIGCCVILCLFPPWVGKSTENADDEFVGHRFIYTGPSVMAIDNASYQKFADKTRHGKKLALNILAIELGAVIIATTLLLIRSKTN